MNWLGYQIVYLESNTTDGMYLSQTNIVMTHDIVNNTVELNVIIYIPINCIISHRFWLQSRTRNGRFKITGALVKGVAIPVTATKLQRHHTNAPHETSKYNNKYTLRQEFNRISRYEGPHFPE